LPGTLRVQRELPTPHAWSNISTKNRNLRVRRHALFSANALPRGFERAPGADEVEQLVQDITDLLWALQTGRVVTPEQALAMSAELSTALDAAWLRLMEQP